MRATDVLLIIRYHHVCKFSKGWGQGPQVLRNSVEYLGSSRAIVLGSGDTRAPLPLPQE